MTSERVPRPALPRVKVCGLTRAEDVELALAAGAEALGFVVHPASPRHVEPARVAELLAGRARDALTVLVLVDATPEFASAALAKSGADAVQLCGAERAESWRDFHAPILRRVPVEPAGRGLLEQWRDLARVFVLDHPASPGGSGRHVDWALAAELARQAPCLLAGGLGPDDVERAVAAVAPLGVDASSRLETSPGCKSPALVHDFVQRARAALFPPQPRPAQP